MELANTLSANSSSVDVSRSSLLAKDKPLNQPAAVAWLPRGITTR